MRNYEGVFILTPDLTSEACKGGVAQIQELVTKNGGRVDGLQEWGKKDRKSTRLNSSHNVPSRMPSSA